MIFVQKNFLFCLIKQVTHICESLVLFPSQWHTYASPLYFFLVRRFMQYNSVGPGTMKLWIRKGNAFLFMTLFRIRSVSCLITLVMGVRPWVKLYFHPDTGFLRGVILYKIVKRVLWIRIRRNRYFLGYPNPLLFIRIRIILFCKKSAQD